MSNPVLRSVFVIAVVASLSGCGPKVGEITGQVLDFYTGEPLSGVVVFFREGGMDTQTDEAGGFRFLNVTPGTYTLMARKDNYAGFQPVPVTVQAGQTASGDLRGYCDRPECASVYANSIEGTVRDRFLAEPLPGVSVELASSKRRERAETDAEGSFSFQNLLPEEECSLVFTLDGYSREEEEVRLRKSTGQTATVRAEIQCVAPECAAAYRNSVRGTVLDQYLGKPLGDVRVTLRTGVTDQSVTTGEDGTYSFRDLLPEQDYTLLFERGGYSRGSTTLNLGSEIRQEKELDARIGCMKSDCAGPYELSAGGRVIDYRTNRPMADATILAEVKHETLLAGRENLTTRTSNLGVFKITSLLPNDTVTLRIRKPGEVEPEMWRTAFTVPERTGFHVDLGTIDLLHGGRFLESADGTIFDRVTKLMWVANPSSCGGPFGTRGRPAPMNRPQAEKACEELTYAGHSDWRLPTFVEMAALYEALGEIAEGKDHRVEPFDLGGGNMSLYWVSDRTSVMVRCFDLGVGPGTAGWVKEGEKPSPAGDPLVLPVRSAAGD